METFQVSEQELAQFEVAVAMACAAKSAKPLDWQRVKVERSAGAVPRCFSSSEGSLVISFDRSWYPYLCNIGGDDAEPARWYIPKVSKLIAAIARALQTPMQRAISYVPGSRILLDSSGGRRRPKSSADIAVLVWTLPRKSALLPAHH